MFKRLWMVIMGVGMVLGACSPAEEELLPTRVVLLDNVAVSISATEAISNPTETPVQSGARPLPPTFTPAPSETPIPTWTPTATPAVVRGSVLFVYNEDSIIRINDDGTGQELIITFGVGRRISQMTLSPKGDLIAFVAPGNGSAREIWIANTTGTYLQQISCLGFADVRHPTWSADGQVIGFVASQAENSPMAIYTVGWQGADTCPTGNQQRRITERNSTTITSLAFSADGGRLFFSDDVVYAVSLADFSVSEPLTITRGFGSDFHLAHSPTANTLAYLRDSGVKVDGIPTGNLIGLNVATTDMVSASFQDNINILSFVWRADGEAILQSLQNRVVLTFINGGIATTIDSDAGRFPNAQFSPDANFVAYFDTDSTNLSQIFITPATGGVQRQLTAITEGQIGNFVWVSQ